jgi:hypothetical protein
VACRKATVSKDACGKADASAQAHGITRLTYRDFRIYFQPGKPVDLRRTISGKWEQPTDVDFVFDELHCREAP